jgi:DNA-binding beta-propeller fold protein YncE
MYSTPDGTAMVASRPSFADVVSIDLATGNIKWRFPVSGFRSDHMAVSPDGTRVAVSASTSNNVHVLDIVTGQQLGSFATGDKPHENVFTDGGKYIWNMSIGDVNTDLDDPGQDWTKGDRKITIVDAATFKQVKVIDMRPRLDAFGRRTSPTRSAPSPSHPRRVQAVLPGLLLQRLPGVRRRHRPDHPDQDPAEEPRHQRGP